MIKSGARHAPLQFLDRILIHQIRCATPLQIIYSLDTPIKITGLRIAPRTPHLEPLLLNVPIDQYPVFLTLSLPQPKSDQIEPQVNATTATTRLLEKPLLQVKALNYPVGDKIVAKSLVYPQ